MNNKRVSIVHWISLMIIIIIALLIRIYLLTDWLAYDECGQFIIAKSAFYKTIVNEILKKQEAPLSFIFVKPLIILGSSAYHVKMAALLSGLVSIVLINIMLRKYVQSFWAVPIGTFFFSIIPVFVQQSVEAMQYSQTLLFTCASLLVYFHMHEHNFQKFSDHILLALTCFFALMTKYIAIFHVIVLTVIVYGQLFLLLFRRKKCKHIIIFALPQILVFCIVGITFRIHFHGIIPRLTHTFEYMYDGQLTDIENIMKFFISQFASFINGILPLPWGFFLVGLVIVPFFPFFRNSTLWKISRIFSFYSIISIGFIFFASLFRLFPFGGDPRRTIMILPGILLTCFLVIVVIINQGIQRKWVRIIGTTLITLMFLPGFAKGLYVLIANKEKKTYKDFIIESGLSAYSNIRGTIITGLFGREIISWWLLRERTSRLIESVPGYYDVFDYEGIRVIELTDEENQKNIQIVRHVVSRYGECWIIIGHPELPSLEEELKKDSTITLKDKRMVQCTAFYLTIINADGIHPGEKLQLK